MVERRPLTHGRRWEGLHHGFGCKSVGESKTQQPSPARDCLPSTTMSPDWPCLQKKQALLESDVAPATMAPSGVGESGACFGTNFGVYIRLKFSLRPIRAGPPRSCSGMGHSVGAIAGTGDRQRPPIHSSPGFGDPPQRSRAGVVFRLSRQDSAIERLATREHLDRLESEVWRADRARDQGLPRRLGHRCPEGLILRDPAARRSVGSREARWDSDGGPSRA